MCVFCVFCVCVLFGIVIILLTRNVHFRDKAFVTSFLFVETLIP